MQLVALKNIRYGTRAVQAGEEFTELRASHVRALIATGQAKEVPKAEEKPAKGKYQRRDMRSED